MTKYVQARARGRLVSGRLALGALACSAALWACTGSLGAGQSGAGPEGGEDDAATGGAGSAAGATSSSPTEGPISFACSQTPAKSPVDALRSLSTAQYQNTVSDLVAFALKDASAAGKALSDPALATALAGLQQNLPTVPTAPTSAHAAYPDGGYERGDQDIQLIRVRSYFAIGLAVGDALTTPERIGTSVGACAAQSDTTCLTNFLHTFGARALRRPLTDDDVAFYTKVYQNDTTGTAAAYGDVIAALLNAPEFLYFVEHGEVPVPGFDEGSVYRLGAFELASRLSYHIWDTMPDDELWAKASDGTLVSDDATYASEINRMFSDPRARASIDRFFADYFQVAAVTSTSTKGGLNYRGNIVSASGDPIFKAFAGADLPGADFAQNLLGDALGFVDYYLWKKPGGVKELMTSPAAFATTDDVAHLYGLAKWDGSSAPPTFPAGQRPGLFTRALFTAGGVTSNPIMKGVYLRRYVLCDAIGPPPPAAMNASVVLPKNETTRQEVAALTANAPCSGCHPTLINPLGFATEDFDGLGRHRAQETVFSQDASGKVTTTTLPIDTTSTPRVALDDATTTSRGASDLMNLALASGKVEACLTRNYFRYTFGRFEDLTTGDTCSLAPMLDKLKGDGKMVDMLEEVVNTPAFKQRTFQ